MTWSIVARDPATGAVGAAIASKFFGIGAYCPHVRSGVGAISTQSLVNPLLGPWGLGLMQAGASASAALDALIAADPGQATRQVHAVDNAGRTAAHTGDDCVDWAGQRAGDGVSVAGNMLAGAAVVEDTLAAYLESDGAPFAERLLRAMDAGERAGGDKRGRQGAALRIMTTECYPALDLRVDDHADAVAELWRLYEVAHERAIVRAQCMPTRADPAGLYVFEELEAEIDARLKAQPDVDFSAFWKTPQRPD